LGVVWRGKTSAFEMCFPRQKEKHTAYAVCYKRHIQSGLCPETHKEPLFEKSSSLTSPKTLHYWCAQTHYFLRALPAPETHKRGFLKKAPFESAKTLLYWCAHTLYFLQALPAFLRALPASETHLVCAFLPLTLLFDVLVNAIRHVWRYISAIFDHVAYKR